MIYGRGKHYAEIYALGMQLKEQFDQRYPGLVEAGKNGYESNLSSVIAPKITQQKTPEFVTQKVELLSAPTNAKQTLEMFAKTTGFERFDFNLALKDNKLAKLLEHFNYTFKVENFALIILKHYTRHRMQSLSTAPIFKMCESNKFVIPETIEQQPELKELFVKAIQENRRLFNKLVQENTNPYLMIYAVPHCAAIDFVSTVNARELLHLCNLRTCTRAQWTIRYLVTEMLEILKKHDPEMFKVYGPSCFTFGVCPEGRLCCGKQLEMKEKFKV